MVVHNKFEGIRKKMFSVFLNKILTGNGNESINHCKFLFIYSKTYISLN